MSANYISWLLERRRAANASAVAEDASESDVPVEKCRAKGGPGHCAVHGPVLKEKIGREDDLSPARTTHADVAKKSSRGELSDGFSEKEMADAFSGDLEQWADECDAESARNAMKSLAKNAKADLSDFDRWRDGDGFGTVSFSAEAKTDLKEGSPEFEDVKASFNALCESMQSDYGFNEKHPKQSVSVENGVLRATYTADVNRAEKHD